MENFSLRHMKNKIQEIVREYLAEEFLKSLETKEEHTPDLEYTQTISDSVLDISANEPLRFMYQVRTSHLSALELLFATYHRVLKNVEFKLQIHHSINQQLLYEDSYTRTIKDNEWISFPIGTIDIARHTPITITLSLTEKINHRLSIWYGRNVNVYGGFFRIGKKKMTGYPALRIYTGEPTQPIPSLELNEANMDFLEKIQSINEDTKKEQKEIVEEYEALFHSLLTENKGLEEKVEQLEREKELLFKQAGKSSEEGDQLIKAPSPDSTALFQRLLEAYTTRFAHLWNNPFYRFFYIWKYRWFLTRQSGEFPAAELKAGIELEQPFQVTSPSSRIYLYWGTHKRTNTGTVHISLYNRENQLLKSTDIQMENLPDLTPVPFVYDFSPQEDYLLKLNCQDGMTGNFVSPMATRKRSTALPALRLNGYRLPAALKITFQ